MKMTKVGLKLARKSTGLIYLLCSAMVIAEQLDVSTNGSTKNLMNMPNIPDFKPLLISNDYPPRVNIFDSKRIRTKEAVDIENFIINQLQMVGYLRYHNVKYAFLRTPKMVIKVKSGDKLKDAIVLNVTENWVEIEQNNSGENTYHNSIIRLELNSAP